MTVNKQAGTDAVLAFGIACKMDFPHPVQGQLMQHLVRIAIVIHAADIEVIHIEQQSAAGTVDHLTDKIGLTEGGGREFNIGGRILEQYLATQRILDLIDMFTYPVQRGLCVR